MKNTTFEYIRNMIRNHMNEEAVAPTMSVGTGGFSSGSSASGPVAGRDAVGFKKRNKKRKLPDPDKDLFRRKENV